MPTTTGHWNTPTPTATARITSIPRGPDDPPGEPHNHPHQHGPVTHAHPHYPDIHHRHPHP